MVISPVTAIFTTGLNAEDINGIPSLLDIQESVERYRMEAFQRIRYEAVSTIRPLPFYNYTPPVLKMTIDANH
jgi:hypothetical protein